jgi:hypothetical protein
MNLAQLAQQAIDVQNACNPIAIANGMVNAMQELRKLGIVGSEELATHPVTQLWVAKLSYLCGLEEDSVSVAIAYHRCYEIIDKQESKETILVGANLPFTGKIEIPE